MIATQDGNKLIDDYYRWLRDRTILRAIKNSDWLEITAPFLDRHNDYLQLYVRREGQNFMLSDDGETISDLHQSGCNLNSEKRKKTLQATLNGFGVSLGQHDALEVRATPEQFAAKKHNLLQAMLAVNDLFYLAQASVQSFFMEDVALWMDQQDIRYSENVKFTGKSGFDQHFDFLIPKSKSSPERIIKTVNNPNRDHAQSVVFAWLDTREVRPPETIAGVFLNDSENRIQTGAIDALTNYGLVPIPWSERQNYAQMLAS